MLNPDGIYSYAEGIDADEVSASTMLVALDGFVDAGHTQQQVADYILEHHESQLVASFDVDQVVDYRGRRPTMVFDTDHYASYDAPSIELHRVTDVDGTAFLLLRGVEPDYQWERVAAAVLGVVKELGVTLTITTMHGIPMGVPHTRPIGVLTHATDNSLIGGTPSPFGKVAVPASFDGLLELRLREGGHDAVGFAVHVPHYLAQMELPMTAAAALDRVVAVTGLRLRRAKLDASAEAARVAIEEQLRDKAEIKPVVAALEQQYDAYMGSLERPSLLAADDSELPTADEIGAELEAFLRGQGEN
ncbi:PAC2 family protein [Cumulibacter soli]|uniref:PAC2 family protein n=1 Tax=Cumulibacter soli TaxID=2546344 RepID=UPI00106769DC|nr:PAC2 family protein [Cumulibacter soli]